MTSSRNAGALVASGSSGFGTVHADRFALPDLDPHPPQSRGSSELTTIGRADRSLVVYAEKPPRILLVDAALALHELHLVLLRSIPAIVESLASSAEYVPPQRARLCACNPSVPSQIKRDDRGSGLRSSSVECGKNPASRKRVRDDR
jgi:hypothetical protein